MFRSIYQLKSLGYKEKIDAEWIPVYETAKERAMNDADVWNKVSKNKTVRT